MKYQYVDMMAAASMANEMVENIEDGHNQCRISVG